MVGLLWFFLSLLSIATLANWQVGGLAIGVLSGVAVGLAAALEKHLAQGIRTGASDATATPTEQRPVHENRVGTDRKWVHFSKHFLVANEFWLLVFLSPLLVLARRDFAVVFLIIPILWILRWRVQGRLTERTPLDWPIALLLAMVAVGALVSADVDRSMPKIAGILFGVGVFYAVINGVHSERDIAWVALGLILVGGAIGLVGLVGSTASSSNKFIPLQISALIPRWIQVPGTVEGQINPNEVGGSLAFVFPFLLCLSLTRWDIEKNDAVRRLARRGGSLIKLALWPALIWMGAMLILTQSRSALFGAAISFFIFSLIRWPKVRWLVGVLLLGLVTFALTHGFDFVVQAMTANGAAVGTLDLAARQEVWERALYAIQDFPFTGVGLNMFEPVTRVLYPYFLIPPDTAIGHAHNMLMQVTVDLGIPGLVAYVALLTAFGYMVGKVTIASPSSMRRSMALALALGMMAHQIFGLTDAIALGAKPGIIFWIMLALAGNLWRQDQIERQSALPSLDSSGTPSSV